MKKKFCQAEIMEIDGEKMFVASDETVDRHGEVIAIDGWDLENYKANPTILWAHDQHYPKIGNAEKIGYKNVNGEKKLVFKPIFHKKDELSRLVGELVEEGWITASSVGFMPKEINDNVIEKSELLEISFVNVPANPNALQLMYSKGFEDETIKDVMPEFEKAKYELKIKDLETQIESKDAEIKELKKSDVELKPQQPEVTKGRKAITGSSNQKAKFFIALKALNKEVENLNKIKKEIL